jgi:hypothetical protein
MLEDIAQGIERLQSFIPQIEDLGRDGFPYLEGARARTELQIKECIKKTFGDKSPEFQAYRQHRLSVETPADTKQTVALLKTLIGVLEDKKLEIQGLKPPPPAAETTPTPAAPPPPSRPALTLVPSTPTAQVTITPAAPVVPPPITMSVALTTNLDMTQSSAMPPQAAAPQQTPPTPAKPQPTAPTPHIASIAVEASPVLVPQQTVVASSPAVTQSIPVASIPEPVHPSTPEPVRSSPAAPAAPQQPSLQESQPMIPTAVPLSKSLPPVLDESKLAGPSLGQPAAAPVSSSSPEPFTQPLSSPKPPSSIGTDPSLDPSEAVKSLCKRFHMVARQLRLRGEYRATLNVEDELDAQDLLHALLRLYFDDIETSEWAPSYANGTPRVMFLLNDGHLAVIVKKTKSGLNTRDLTEQLRADIEHCRTLKRCSTLLYFVYDPEGRIGNPRGLETDLISISDQLTVDVYVAPK